MFKFHGILAHYTGKPTGKSNLLPCTKNNHLCYTVIVGGLCNPCLVVGAAISGAHFLFCFLSSLFPSYPLLDGTTLLTANRSRNSMRYHYFDSWYSYPRYFSWSTKSVPYSRNCKHKCLVFKLADDRMALVSGISLDPEAAVGVTRKLPPKWVEGIDEVTRSRNFQNSSISRVTAPMSDDFGYPFRSSMTFQGFVRRWRTWHCFTISTWIDPRWMTAVKKSTPSKSQHRRSHRCTV